MPRLVIEIELVDNRRVTEDIAALFSERAIEDAILVEQIALAGWWRVEETHDE